MIEKPIVVYKMSRPLLAGKLWEHVRHPHAEKLVMVISANDLRAGGVNISRCLSWERTALDFLWQMASNPALFLLSKCENPSAVEGDLQDRYPAACAVM